MKILSFLLVVVLTCSICSASEVKKVENPEINKIQTTSDLHGQISTFEDIWYDFVAKDKKGLDKAVEYFYKIRKDPKATLYIKENMIVGATSPKYGSYGNIPKENKQAQKKTLSAKVVGCDFQQGHLYCAVKLKGKRFYINEESSDADLKVLNDNPGSNVKIFGKIEGDTIKATAVSLQK